MAGLGCLALWQAALGGCAQPPPNATGAPTGGPQPAPGTALAAFQDGASPAAADAPVSQDIRHFAELLRGDQAANNAELRTWAARKLLAIDDPEAAQVLADALTDGGQDVTTAAAAAAVIHAVQSAPSPPAALLDAAITLLKRDNHDLREPLAEMILAYGSEGVAAIAGVAGDTMLDDAQRLGAVYTLGLADDVAAAVKALVPLIDGSGSGGGSGGGGEPDVIGDAAFDSLRALTGQTIGNDAARWNRWIDNQGPIDPQARNEAIQRELEQRIARMLTKRDLLIADFLDALRELYGTSANGAAPARLTKDLGSAEPEVREFAIGRVEQLIRDGEVLPPAVIAKLIERVGDAAESDAHRLRVAQILNFDLKQEGICELVAGGMENVSDPQIADGFLKIFADRPCAASMPAVLTWLTHQAAGGSAQAALWSLINTRTLDNAQRETALAAVRLIPAEARTPNLLRVLAGAGTDDEVNQLAPLMDGDDAAVAAAVAEGFALRGLQQPLLDRAANEAVYPSAIAVLSGGSGSLARLGRLLSLTPPTNALRTNWEAAVLAMIQSLDPMALPAADDLLPKATPEDRAMRVQILRAVLNTPGDQLTVVTRRELSTRLATQLLAMNNLQGALDALPTVNGDAPPAIDEIRFEANARLGRFDDAAAIHDRPEPWVRLLDRLADAGGASATALRDEIERRFDGAITAELRAIIDSATARIDPPDHPAPDAGDSNAPSDGGGRPGEDAGPSGD